MSHTVNRLLNLPHPVPSLQLYFVFGFLFVVLVILVVTCAEITIVMCYFQVRGCSCCSVCDTQY
jgi:hypothetical protein